MTYRSSHPLFKRLAALREQSRWPDQESFAAQVGLSLGGYRKCETGERIPSKPVLHQICWAAGWSEQIEQELTLLRNDAKAHQVGIPSCQTPAVDCDALAKRLRTETVFVLKQAGVEVKEPTKGVLEKRIAMILKSVLGA